MKSLRILLRFLFMAANILFLVLFMLAAFSDKVSPEKSLFMAYLGLGFPILFVLNFFYALYWLFTRDWKPLLMTLICFLICWGPITRYFPFHNKTNVPQENTIKVLSYNVMNFAGKPHTAQSPNRIIEYIAQSDADIVCLQEYNVATSGKNNLTKEAIQKALAMYPYRAVVAFNKKRPNIGNALYSKYPIRQSRLIDYESDYNGSAYHELDVNGKKMVVINNHLESFKLTQKDKSQYSGLIKSFDTEKLHEIRGTISRKLGPAFLQRAQQARKIAEEINKAEADYILVCGDFNDTPLSYAHRIIQGDLTDAFVASGRGMGSTYNQNFFLFRIDNILHSSNATSYNCTVDHVKYSDHYPMWCYLELGE